MNPTDSPVHWREYMDERFARVHDSLDAIRKDIADYGLRTQRVEERIEAVNSRIWTVGAITGAVGTGLGILITWLTGIGNWIKIIR